VRAVVAIAVSIALASCGGGSDRDRPAAAATRSCAPTIGEQQIMAHAMTLAAAGTPSRVRMGPGMELDVTPRTLAAGRGDALVVTGVVRGTDCAPLAGATINAWQANAAGRYGPRQGAGDRCCYLQGTVRTDARGRYTLDTIAPSGYARGEPHVHMEVGHPRAAGVVTQLVLEGDEREATFDVVLSPAD
jgi:protocatechuate 3,4-dioxygenase beta subunit